MQPAPRKSRHRLRKSPLTEALILKWLVAQHRQTGQWPTQNSGPVVGVPGENWNAIDHGLLRGLRGLAGGSSLARLLAKAGLRRNPKDLPPLQVEQILLWAVDEYQSTGQWPTRESGRVRAAKEESWAMIDEHLQTGGRGLPGGATLAGMFRLYRDILSRAHWGLPHFDGERTVDTPEQVVAGLVARGALKQPEWLKTLMQRQREFLREAAD